MRDRLHRGRGVIEALMQPGVFYARRSQALTTFADAEWSHKHKFSMKNIVNYELIREKKWTEFLKSLPIGNYTIQMDDNKSIHSMKVVAYSINSDGDSENIYNFSVSKRTRTLTIKVIPRGEERVIRSQ